MQTLNLAIESVKYITILDQMKFVHFPGLRFIFNQLFSFVISRKKNQKNVFSVLLSTFFSVDWMVRI